MKRKLASIMILCFVTAFCYARGSVTVKSGNLAILKEEGTAELVIDYSVAEVDGGTLEDYLEKKGDDYVRDWPDVQNTVNEDFVKTFNELNKKGMKITLTESPDNKYKMIFQVKNLDMGSLAAAIVGSAMWGFPTKAGGIIVSGLLEIINKSTGKSLCCVEVDGIKGRGVFSETSRMLNAYTSVLEKVLKKAKRAKNEGGFTETEPIISLKAAKTEAKVKAPKKSNETGTAEVAAKETASAATPFSYNSLIPTIMP